MPLHIKDDATALLVARLTKLQGISKEDAVKLAVRARLNRVEEALPLRDRFAALRAARPAPTSWRTRRSSMPCPASHDGLRGRRPLPVVVVGERETNLAADAYTRFGKGRHPAVLNMSDCFAYASAKANDASLLYKGSRFAKTDLR